MNTQATRFITLPENPPVRQRSEMACPEESRITSLPLQPQRQASTEWAGVLTDEFSGQERQVRKTLAFSNQIDA